MRNTYIINAVLTTKIKEPLTLELDIDLKYLYETNQLSLIDYLVNHKTLFTLNIEGVNTDYTFKKKTNQVAAYALVGTKSEDYQLVTQANILPNSKYYYKNGFYRTINGTGIFILKKSPQTSYNFNDSVEFIRYENVENSQNMVNKLFDEETSISQQSIENNILRITLFSSLLEIDYCFSNIVYGQAYNLPLVDFLNDLLPNWQITCDTNPIINYTVPNKNISQILEDVLIDKIYRCNGQDTTTFNRKLSIYDSRTLKPAIRCLDTKIQTENPNVLKIKENFPTYSASVNFNNTYVREGEKIMLNYYDIHNNIAGEFLFDGASWDLITRTNTTSTVNLQKTNRDVRKNYMESNNTNLSQKMYE